MDPTLTPTPNLVAASPRSQGPSSSRSSPTKDPQRSEYPLSADNKAGNGPMGGREEDHGPSTPSRTRLETPPPDNGSAAKPSKSSKRRKNRNRKRRKRQESFLTPSLEEADERSGAVSGAGGGRESMEGDQLTTNDNQSYFQLRRNLSSTSLESDALLDHRSVTRF